MVEVKVEVISVAFSNSFVRKFTLLIPRMLYTSMYYCAHKRIYIHRLEYVRVCIVRISKH